MTTDQGFNLDSITAHEIPPSGRISYVKNVDGTFSPASALSGGATPAVANAAAPTNIEGASVPLSVDLAGGLRVTGTINATTTATAKTAAPSYTDNTSNPLSQNLTGDLRTIAKQSGSWTVGVDHTTPGVTDGIDVTNFPVTVDVNAGNASANTIRVVVATNQAALPVTIATAPVLVAGSAIIGKVGIDQTTPGTTNAVQLVGATNNINNISGTVSLPTGAATAANQVTEIANQATEITSLAAIASVLTVPGGADQDTAVSCLNTIVSLLQEINYRLREQPVNLATALNQTLNLSAGPLPYSNIESADTFALSTPNRLTN